MLFSIFGRAHWFAEPFWCWEASSLHFFCRDSRGCILPGRWVFPAFAALWGTYETLRCLRLRWSFYHGGVLLLLYMDVMALAMIFFLLLYPYAGWLQ